MQTKIIIFGSSFQANVILLELKNFKNYKVIGFCDEKKPINKIINKKYKLKNLGKFKDISKKLIKTQKVLLVLVRIRLEKKLLTSVNPLIKNLSGLV